MKITFFTEILSSWCYWAEPAWDEVRRRFPTGVTFEWRIALMQNSDFPTSRAQCDWFYHRSGSLVRSPFKLNSAWLEPERRGDYRAPNLVAEAGRDLGFEDDRLRRGLTNAALRDGRRIGELNEAVAVAAALTGQSANTLRQRALSPEVGERVAASTALFHTHQATQRPAFLIENAIGDKAMISGLWTAAPLIATIEAMQADAAGYAEHRARSGEPPDQ